MQQNITLAIMRKKSRFGQAFLRAVMCLALAANTFTTCFSQDGAADLEVQIAEGIERSGANLTVPVPTDAESGKMYLPRYFASLRRTAWGDGERASQASDDPTISIKPEPDYWIVSWKDRPASATHLHVVFDSKPLLAEEMVPTKAAGDGSFDLPASSAFTSGEKVRFEPQTFKNTVGYWVGAQDNARWQIVVSQPGEFNVGILQGCGAGQGGSEAVVRAFRADDSGDLPAKAKPSDEAEFEVLETGHFQNFQWRHVGEITMDRPGIYWIEVRPIAIKKNALMDIRRLQLVRRPSKS